MGTADGEAEDDFSSILLFPGNRVLLEDAIAVDGRVRRVGWRILELVSSDDARMGAAVMYPKSDPGA